MKKIFLIGTLATGLLLTACSEEKSEEINQKEEVKTEETNQVKKVKFDDMNNFQSFVTQYEKIPDSEKTGVWDSQLAKKEVTWTGKFIEGFDSRFMMYGFDDYENEDWSGISENDKAYKSFVARFKDSVDYNQYEKGQEVTIKGVLDSRGSKTANSHWIIIDAEIKE